MPNRRAGLTRRFDSLLTQTQWTGGLLLEISSSEPEWGIRGETADPWEDGWPIGGARRLPCVYHFADCRRAVRWRQPKFSFVTEREISHRWTQM